MTDGEDLDYETDSIAPDEDIDLMYDVDYLRIERMSDDSLWFAGFADGEDALECMFWATCTDDGLRIDTEIHPDGM
ncbi:hypothetical protein [Natrinema sp. 1APR25-10V2]|uniref:hypothetical protein n=1 Tax=Natrinema sp. 1APR25-10V2 TaxID=2951081 RepID=UPI002876C6CA|nr:hypothetical protein [Natrinema sp. 1APR25-10V2]MDS0474790.1 hypothetical protein [Natrinema sp. 1APR25-10V2]